MKRIVSSLLVLCMVASLTVTSFAAETNESPKQTIHVETVINGQTVSKTETANGVVVDDKSKTSEEVTVEQKGDTKTNTIDSLFSKILKELIIQYIKDNPEEVMRILSESNKDEKAQNESAVVKEETK